VSISSFMAIAYPNTNYILGFELLARMNSFEFTSNAHVAEIGISNTIATKYP